MQSRLKNKRVSQKKLSVQDGWRLAVIALIAVFFCKELFWAYLVPPWKAPDELAHLGYVQSMYEQKEFPLLGETTFTERDYDAIMESVHVHTIKDDNQDGASGAGESTGVATADANPVLPPGVPYINWIAQHPPLYYMMLEPFYGLYRAAMGQAGAAAPESAAPPGAAPDNLSVVFLLRLVSILLGCLTLFFSAKTLRIIFPGRDMFTFAVLAGMAFLPGFSHISALVNNDNLVFALSSVLFYFLAKEVYGRDHAGKEEGHFCGGWKIGIVLGLLALTKITALPLWIAASLILGVKYLRVRRQRLQKEGMKPASLNHAFVKYLAVMFGVALLISGWWYVRNLYLYGAVFPDLSVAVARNPSLLQTWPDLTQRFPEIVPIVETAASESGHSALGAGDFLINRNFFWTYFKNFWGLFNIPPRNLDPVQNFLYAFLLIFALAGYLWHYGSSIIKNRQKILGSKNTFFILPVVSVFVPLIIKLYQIYLGRGFLGAMHGRYVYSVLLPLMVLILGGLVPAEDGAQSMAGAANKSCPSGQNQPCFCNWKKAILPAVVIFFVLSDFYTLFYLVIPEFY